MDIQNYYQSFAERLQASAQVKTIFGEPIEALDRIIIPVASIGYGFGGGPVKKGETDSVVSVAGGGGGVGAKPIGVFEITDTTTRFIPVGYSWKKGAISVAVGFGLGYLLGQFLSQGHGGSS